MGRRHVAVGLAAYLVAAAALFGPWLGEEREVVEGTPAHPPLYQQVPVEVKPGARLCVEPVTITDRTDRIRFGTLMPEDQAFAVEVAAEAPGYRSAATVRGVQALAVDAAIEPPPRDVEGRVCFRNRGERALPLLGTTDQRILSRAHPVVDGEPLPRTEVAVTLVRSGPGSLAGRAGELFEHAEVVNPGFVAPWLLWLLLPLVAVGIPAGALAALAAAAKPEDREQERREEDLQPDDQ